MRRKNDCSELIDWFDGNLLRVILYPASNFSYAVRIVIVKIYVIRKCLIL